MFHEYEIVFIIRPDLDDADTVLAVERVETTIADTGGHLLERDDWGKRRLAYLVQKHAKGHYILLRVLSEPAQILEIERKMRLDDRIIRFLSVKIADAVDVEPRLALAEEQRKVKEEEARRRAERAALHGEQNEDDDSRDDDRDSNSARAAGDE